MPFDRFLIAPQKTGLQLNLHPWLINDDAWQILRNAYAFRGRIRKRFGSQLMSTVPNYSRLGVQVGTIGAPISPVPGNIFAIGQQFQAGAQIFTVVSNAAGPQAMLATGPGTGTFDVTTGNFAIAATGLPGTTPIYWYPNQPVMGIAQWNNGPFNNIPSFAFDTQFAYTWNGTQWIRSDTVGVPTFHGTDLNFFWTANSIGTSSAIPTFYVANNYVVNPNGVSTINDDSLWTFNEAGTQQWDTFTPYFRPNNGNPRTGPFVKNCRIIIPFQNSLLLLNTIENDNSGGGGVGVNTHYPQRCRYSWLLNPTTQNAWYEPGQNDNNFGMPLDPLVNIAGGGNFADAPTDEEIISAQLFKNRLIVFFENSTWEIIFQSNSLSPFRWQQINPELGSESTFGTIPHDRFVLTMGSTGVHSCNGNNVERIDDLIPDEIFFFKQENTAPQRVAGIRDFFVECDYWAFPSNGLKPDQVYPDTVLHYNYKTGSWAIIDDCITAFGYFDQQPALTWATWEIPWEENNQPWGGGDFEKQQRQIIAGNTQGFMFYIKSNLNANATNMQITDIQIVGLNTQLTVTNHTFAPVDYVYIKNVQGVIGLNNGIWGQEYVDKDHINIFFVDPDTGEWEPAPITGVYTGGGIISRVSDINMLSKQWNPYATQDRNLFLQKIDFMVLRTAAGEFSVGNFASSANINMVLQGIATGASLTTGIVETSPYDEALYPLEQEQDFLWHPMYFQSDGEFIQIFIFWLPQQISNSSIAFAPFELEALALYTQPTRYRME